MSVFVPRRIIVFDHCDIVFPKLFIGRNGKDIIRDVRT